MKMKTQIEEEKKSVLQICRVLLLAPIYTQKAGRFKFCLFDWLTWTFCMLVVVALVEQFRHCVFHKQQFSLSRTHTQHASFCSYCFCYYYDYQVELFKLNWGRPPPATPHTILTNCCIYFGYHNCKERALLNKLFSICVGVNLIFEKRTGYSTLCIFCLHLHLVLDFVAL